MHQQLKCKRDSLWFHKNLSAEREKKINKINLQSFSAQFVDLKMRVLRKPTRGSQACFVTATQAIDNLHKITFNHGKTYGLGVLPGRAPAASNTLTCLLNKAIERFDNLQEANEYVNTKTYLIAHFSATFVK